MAFSPAASSRTKIQLAALSCLLIFWAASLWNLDRFPFPYYDEGIILAPGWKLVTTGIYGSDPYTGYYGAERIFLQFMPLASMLEGAVMYFIGLGLFHARFVAVGVGLLFLALTYAVATRLFNARTGVWSIILLLAWQMLPNGGPVYRTGIPIIDLMRVVRHDTLSALWGLAAFWCFIRSRETQQYRFYYLCGLLIGPAGLSHIYGIFWGVGFVAAMIVERWRGPRFPFIPSVAVLTLGVISALLPWAVVTARNWPDFLGQQLIEPQRFRVLEPQFYLGNLYHELRRYGMGIDALTNASTYLRAGFWLTAVGVPLALVWLAGSAWRKREQQSLRLLVTLLVVMALFALLLEPKLILYLPTPESLMAISLAALLTALWDTQRTLIRIGLALVLAIVVGQASYHITEMHRHAASLPPATALLAQIRASIPPGSRVLSMANYWLAVPEPGFRFFHLTLLLSDPAHTRSPISGIEALTQIAPDYLVQDAGLRDLAAQQRTPYERAFSADFRAYMEQHNATLVGTVVDGAGNLVEVYHLQQENQPE